MWGLVERKCKWGSLGVGQMWVFLGGGWTRQSGGADSRGLDW